MAYGNMTNAVSGQVASAAANNQIITNVEDLDTRLDSAEATIANGTSGNSALNTRLGTVESRTLNTSGNVGIGNQRLSDRLGPNVDTTASTTTGTASTQFADLRSRIVTLEAATGGAKPIAHLYRPYTGAGGTNQVVSNSTWTAVLFPNEAVDNFNGHSTVTNTSRYTATQAGWYKVSGVVMGTPVAGIGVGARIQKNGALPPGAGYSGLLGSAAIAPGAFTETFVQMNGTTDYVELFGWVSTGAAFGAGLDYASYMMIEFVSA